MLRNTRRDTAEDVLDEARVNPWEKIDKTLRGLDIDQVHDCKEDMDTLLVFAGLYSAVLTSLLVQSSQNLQENYQKTTTELLHHISSQTSSYTIRNGLINSASPQVHLRQFKAELTDVRVNNCWFASLILSLSAASFAMLVKQWLREYLAVYRVVPKERIRVRSFRAHGVEEWKLFEFAAVLPLILQLSLALFFVGLCLFTSEIHPSLRATSVTLVSGWALVFAFTFFAPLMSARCPYKTTFLKIVFRRLRLHIRPFVSGYVGLFVKTTAVTLRAVFAKCIRASGRLHSVALPIPLSQRGSSYVTQGDYDHDPDDQDFLPKLPKFIVDTILDYTLDEVMDVTEEDYARMMSRNDLIILKNVDDTFRDDDLLSMMRMALRQGRQKSQDVLAFVVSILRSRLGITAPLHNATSVPRTLRQLGPWTCLTFMNILCDSLLEHHRQSDILEISIKMMALVVLLSQEVRSILKGEMDVFQQILSDEHFCSQVIPRVVTSGNTPGETSYDWQRLVFESMRGTFKTLDPSVLRLVVHKTYIDHHEDPTTDSNTYGRLLDQIEGTHPSDPELDKITFPVLKILLDLAISIVQHSTDQVTHPKQLNRTIAHQVKELLQFFFDSISVIQVQVGSDSFMAWYLPNKTKMDAMMEHFFTLPPLFLILLKCLGAHRGLILHEISYILERPAQGTFEGLSDNGKEETLMLLVDHLEVMQKDPALSTTYKVLFMYWFILWITRGNGRWELRKRISTTITKCLQKALCLTTTSGSPLNAEGSSPDEQHAISSLAHHILKLIDERREDGMPSGGIIVYPDAPSTSDPRYAEDDNICYSRWKEAFNVEESEYGDGLVSLLCDLSETTPGYGGWTCWRARRLGREGSGRRGSIDSPSVPSLTDQDSMISDLHESGVPIVQSMGSEEVDWPIGEDVAAGRSSNERTAELVLQDACTDVTRAEQLYLHIS